MLELHVVFIPSWLGAKQNYKLFNEPKNGPLITETSTCDCMTIFIEKPIKNYIIIK